MWHRRPNHVCVHTCAHTAPGPEVKPALMARTLHDILAAGSVSASSRLRRRGALMPRPPMPSSASARDVCCAAICTRNAKPLQRKSKVHTPRGVREMKHRGDGTVRVEQCRNSASNFDRQANLARPGPESAAAFKDKAFKVHIPSCSRHTYVLKAARSLQQGPCCRADTPVTVPNPFEATGALRTSAAGCTRGRRLLIAVPLSNWSSCFDF